MTSDSSICQLRSKASAILSTAGTTSTLSAFKFGTYIDRLTTITSGLLLSLILGCAGAGNGLLTPKDISVAGVVQGAMQPIANAEVHLYTVDPQNVSAAKNVELTAAVRSDAQGLFHFPTSLPCPTADSLVYLKAVGGVPAATGFVNHSISLLNVLGTCSSLSTGMTATINELTTVGAAWPLATFANSSDQFLPTNAQAAQFDAAVELVGKLVHSSAGTTPGSLLTIDEAAPVPAMNSLADAISACIVTSGGVVGDGSACGELFSLANSTSDKAPTDTLAAAIMIAKKPAQNVSRLYALSASRTDFKPSLISAPADWTLALKVSSAMPVVTAGTPISVASTDNAGAVGTPQTDSSLHMVPRAASQAAPLVANPLVIRSGGTYQGNWVSTDPTVAAVTVLTDQPVVIQNSTVTGPGNLIAVTGSAGANLTVRNVSGTAVDPMVLGKARGAFVVAYIMNSLTVQNCTMTGTMFGIKVGFSNAGSVHILNNRAVNLEDRTSDGNGGFQATRAMEGHFIYFYQVVTPNGAEIGWNQMVQTIGQSSVSNAIEIYKSQGTSATPILVHDNYLEGMSSPAVTPYTGSGLAATGDNTTLESDFINFVSNEVVHTAGSGLSITNGHDISAQSNRVVSCGQNTGVWDTKAGVYGIVLWNRSNSPTFYNNTITTTAGGLVVPNSSSNPVAADSSANPVDLKTESNSISGNQFTDPCLVGGTLTMSAEDTERGFWANKLSTHAQTLGDQHGPVTVTVTPATFTVAASGTQQLSASVAWASNTAVSWAISPAIGSISSTGLYTAPSSVTTQQTVTATATSAQDGSTTGTATASVSPTTVVTPPSGTGASKLAFVLQPASTYSGYSLTPAVAVIVVDASGNPVTTGAVQISLALATNSTGAVLKGTQTATSGATPALFSNLSIASAGSGYTLVASSPGFGSVSSTSFSIANSAANGPTFYVSNGGSDANSGTTASAPWLTISKVNSSVHAAGAQVLFQAGGVWHEELIPSSGIRYAWYGAAPVCIESPAFVPSCVNMPVIDGADPVTGWASYATGAYKAPYTPVASKGFVDALYQQTTPLTLGTSAATVATTSGTIYSDGSFVYVHLTDGSDPATHTVEVSGARPYGIAVTGPSNVVIDGLAVIRTAKSGYLNYAFPGTGNGNIVENSLFFNNGDSLGDAALGGQIEASILSTAGYNQAAPAGFVASGNLVGQSDFPHSTLNYAWAGILVNGMASPQVIGNRVATVNGWAIRVQDWFTGNTCVSPLILGNETVNSEGNVGFAGCPGTMAKLNYTHDSFGNFAQLGSGLSAGNLDMGSHVEFNTFTRIGPAYSNGLYNGIDVNHAANLVIVGNRCSAVSSACLTLEADSGPSSGATIMANTFDASSNMTWQGQTPGGKNRVYPFYIRDTSLAGGLTMSGNVLVMDAATPFIKFGATSAGDQSHDLTMAQFVSTCPKCQQ